MKTLTMGAVMTPCPVKVDAQAELSAALQIMNLRRIRHLAVTAEGGELIGLLHKREAELIQASSQAGLKAGEVCSKEVFVVRSSELLRDAAKAMAENKAECALVIDDEEHVAGIFTTMDACRLIHLMLCEREGL